MPIAQVVLPLLNALAKMLISVGQAFATFMARLFNVGDSYKDIIGDWESSGADFSGIDDLIESGADASGDLAQGLGDSSKSAKELKKQLIGIDEINNLTTPTDTSSSGSGGSGGASGSSGYIADLEFPVPELPDPEPFVEKWVQKLEKAFSKIFAPIKNSWDKYGMPIMVNISKAFENLGAIGSGIFDTVGDNWTKFFQRASDLFFSLLDTGSLIFNKITEFLRDIWDKGGKNFLEGLLELGGALANFATSVNDLVIKPLIEFLSNTLGKVVSSVIGGFLNLLGDIFKALADFINMVSKCEWAVKLLGAAFIALEIAKFVSNIRKIWNSFETGLGIIEHVMLTIESMGPHGVQFVKDVEGMRKAWQTFTGFIAAHPILAIASAIAAIGFAVAVFTESQKDAELSIEDCSSAIQDQYNEFKRLTDATKEAANKINESISGTEAEISLFQKYRDNLNKLTGDGGYVKDINKAKSLVEEINKIMPDTVQLTKDGRIEWQKTPEEIDKTIEAMKRLAKQEAYQEAYKEGVKNQIEAERKLNEQKQKQAELQEKVNGEYQAWKSTYNPNATLDEYLNLNTKNNVKLKEQNALVRECQKEYDEASLSLGWVSTQLDIVIQGENKTSKETKDLTTNIKNMSDSAKKSYDSMGKSGQDSFKNIANELNNYQAKLDDAAKNSGKYSKAEIDAIKKTREGRLQELGKMANDFNLTYDDFLEIAKANGIKLSADEMKRLDGIVGMYGTQGQKAGTSYTTNVNTSVNNATGKLTGAVSGVANAMTNVLKGNPVTFSTKVDDITGKTSTRKSEGQKVANGGISFPTSVAKVSQTVVTNATKGIDKVIEFTGTVGNMTSKGKTAGKQFKSGFAETVAGVLKAAGGAVGNAIKALANITFKAEGGFVKSGQMFIARENGLPELVGRLGNQTAVANNLQIETGIYNAVTKSLNGFSSTLIGILNRFLDTLYRGMTSISIEMPQYDTLDISNVDFSGLVDRGYNIGDKPLSQTDPSNVSGFMEESKRDMQDYMRMQNQLNYDAIQRLIEENRVVSATISLDGRTFYQAMVKEDRRERRNTGKALLGNGGL